VKYRDVLKILHAHGFELARQRGSHHTYKAMVDGQMRVVTLSHHSLNDDIMPKNMASIIRQSGLPKNLFR
jgi:predicted RNA binding protein YcfA (HicA-like mRNA interferase family)